MSFQSYVATCYPNCHRAVKIFGDLSLDDRSLLIKICQAQTIPTNPVDTLYKMTDYNVVFHDPNVFYRRTVCKLRDLFSYTGLSPSHPIQSAILIDILRGTLSTPEDIVTFKEKGWAKEIFLSESPNSSTVNFDYFFDPTINFPPHPDLPHNKANQVKIFNTFRKLRERLQQYKPTFYSRYTHKNMSDSTRAEYTRQTGDGLFGVGIFGQDNWIKHYHETGVQLEGNIEMRQKWYPSNAKPRTYFAQGGSAFRSSRYLQDFFTILVNEFPSTNHITRLQPTRLKIRKMGEETGHYLIYDLSSFTSNMQAQRAFCRSLRDFFAEVEVEIFDERDGLLTLTMGELLDDYNEHCVFDPVLQQNRVPAHLRTQEEEYSHSCASMLGIYGNLMTCTVAHFLIVSPLHDNAFQENNTAGDDGLAHFFLVTYFALCQAILLVGIFALDKTFKSQESSAIALKRPICEDDDTPIPNLVTMPNCVPPNIMVCTCYLLGYEIDSRYTLFYDNADTMSTARRISIVGKDLLRFLESAYKLNLSDPLLFDTYIGYRSLVRSITGHNPYCGGTIDGESYIWPQDPASYSFLLFDPYRVYILNIAQNVMVFEKRGLKPITKGLQFVGDRKIGNSDKWIKVMGMLGYIEREAVMEWLSGNDVLNRLYYLFRKKGLLLPVLYEFEVIKDVPPLLIV